MFSNVIATIGLDYLHVVNRASHEKYLVYRFLTFSVGLISLRYTRHYAA